MRLFFCLGQHSALEAVQVDMREGEFLFAYLDDIYIVARPERAWAVYASLLEHLHRQKSESLGRLKYGTGLG